MARGYNISDVESLIQKSEGGGLFGLLKQGFGNTIGKWAMQNRRPVGYETDKTAANVMGDPEEENWTNTTREALYAKLFGQDPRFGGDIYKQDESGAYILNPDAEGEAGQRAKEIQILMNESFAKARQGEKVSHPDFPDAGESFYRGTDKTLGEAYYDEEGNVVDYWDIGLDKGEKVFDWGNILPGGEPFVNKANLQRSIVSPFTTPATFTGKATDTGDTLGKFAGFGGDEDTPPVSPTVESQIKPTVAQDEKQNLFQKLFGRGGDTGPGTLFKGRSDYDEFLPEDEVKEPIISKEQITGQEEYTPSGKSLKELFPSGDLKVPEGFKGGDFMRAAGDKVKGLFGAIKKPWDEMMAGDEGVEYTPDMIPKKWGGTAKPREEVAPEKGAGINRTSILKALGLGGGEEGGEDYRATMAEKIKGLFGDEDEEEEDYLGTAQQNVEMLRRMGGKGPSIVDFLKSQGKESSFETRRKMWDKFG